MKKLLALILACVLLLSLAACGSNQPTPATPSDATPAPVAGESNTPAAPADGDHTYEIEYWANLKPEDPITWTAPNSYKKIGMVVPDGTGEFYVSMCTSAEKTLKDAGYEFVWTGANDSETAINAIETWTAQGVDALILLVQDTACENAALNAMKQGVLVVLGSATFSSYHVWCCQDYYNIGYNVAKMAAPDIIEKFGEEASYIVIGSCKAEFMTQKTNGVLDGMKDLLPKGTCYEVIDSSNAQNDVETLLTQHPEISAVVSWHATLTMQAMAALDTLGLNDPAKFAVFGSQMTNQSLVEIKDPTSCYVADTWMGDQGRQYVNVVLTLLEGGTVNHYDYAPDFVVNADNAETYYEDYYQEYGSTFKW